MHMPNRHRPIVQHDVRRYHVSRGERLFAPGPNPSVMTITCMSMCLEPRAHLFSFLHHQKKGKRKETPPPDGAAWPGVDGDGRSPLLRRFRPSCSSDSGAFGVQQRSRTVSEIQQKSGTATKGVLQFYLRHRRSIRPRVRGKSEKGRGVRRGFERAYNVF